MSDLHGPDPVIVETVTMVRDRFGAGGLRDLIEMAQRELSLAEAALQELAGGEV